MRGAKVYPFFRYGSYAEIGHSIEKYLKPTDRILQIGCGNSTLADDLYDNGFRRVTSIDIIEDVIRRQNDKNASVRPQLEFHVVDITSAAEGSEILQPTHFQVVLDKGTLDALLPPDSIPEQEATVGKMFEQAHRVLAIGGRYLVVTLAQPEIIRLWIKYFQNSTDRSYILRVQQLNNGGMGSGDDWKLPTFLLVATKLKPPAEGKCAMAQVLSLPPWYFFSVELHISFSDVRVP